MNWTQGGLFLLMKAALEIKAVRYGNISHLSGAVRYGNTYLLSGAEKDNLPISSNSFNKTVCYQYRGRGASSLLYMITPWARGFSYSLNVKTREHFFTENLS